MKHCRNYEYVAQSGLISKLQDSFVTHTVRIENFMAEIKTLQFFSDNIFKSIDLFV